MSETTKVIESTEELNEEAIKEPSNGKEKEED